MRSVLRRNAGISKCERRSRRLRPSAGDSHEHVVIQLSILKHRIVSNLERNGGLERLTERTYEILAPVLSMVASPTFTSHTQYTFLINTLLIFPLIYLPRTTPSQPLLPQTSSIDKPQYEWMRPITGNSLLTLLWWWSGAWIVVGWRAGWVRNQLVRNGNAEVKLERGGRKDKVWLYALGF